MFSKCYLNYQTFRIPWFCGSPSQIRFYPSHRLIFLGFVLDSVKMTVTLTTEKIEKLKALIEQALSNPSQIQISTEAQLIGHFFSCLPAVRHGAVMSISASGQKELSWWLANIRDHKL